MVGGSDNPEEDDQRRAVGNLYNLFDIPSLPILEPPRLAVGSPKYCAIQDRVPKRVMMDIADWGKLPFLKRHVNEGAICLPESAHYHPTERDVESKSSTYDLPDRNVGIGNIPLDEKSRKYACDPDG